MVKNINNKTSKFLMYPRFMTKCLGMSQFVQISHTHQYVSSALPTVADEPASPVKDVSEGEACPTESGFIADLDRATIAKSSTLPHNSAPRIDAQGARELEEQQEKEDMRMNEWIARDAEVARIHAEEELHGMIDSSDKSNKTIAKENEGNDAVVPVEDVYVQALQVKHPIIDSKKFPLPVKVVATARRLEMPLPKVHTAIEEKKKKLPVKDRWQLH
nr:hypothetical protein [Tanacetum cinerariifolium]